MERNDTVIELAVATEATKGPGGNDMDQLHGQGGLGIVED